MKKLTRKLFLSVFTALFAVVALGTTTFAWFSMNDTVKVDGMKVGVKSNNVDLLIGEQNDLNAIQTANGTTVTFTKTGDDVKVFPAAYFKDNDTTPSGSTKVINQNTASTPANWYYKVADKANSSTSTKAATPLTTETFSNYVIKYDLYVCMAKGSNSATNLVVSSSAFSSNNDSSSASKTLEPVRALVVSDNAVVELSAANLSSTTVLASEITDAALVHLTVYVFYDGNSSNVYTNYLANLDGAKITINFSVTNPKA